MVVPLLGLVAFLVSICWNNYAEDYDRSIFPSDDDQANSNKVQNRSSDGHMALPEGENKPGYEEGGTRKIAQDPITAAAEPGSVNNMQVPHERDGE